MTNTAQPAESTPRRERENAVTRAHPSKRGRANLLRIMRKHKGNMQAIADEYGVVKQSMTVLIVERFGLGKELESIREENAKTTREGVLKALASSRTREEAAKKLEIPVRYLYARMRRWRITHEEEDAARAELEAARMAKRKQKIAASAARVARR